VLTIRVQIQETAKLVWRIFIFQKICCGFIQTMYSNLLRKMKPRHIVDTMRSSSSEVKDQNRTKTLDSIEPSFLRASISLGAQFHYAKPAAVTHRKKYMGHVLHIACILYL
jgi:hypothetical protein